MQILNVGPKKSNGMELEVYIVEDTQSPYNGKIVKFPRRGLIGMLLSSWQRQYYRLAFEDIEILDEYKVKNPSSEVRDDIIIGFSNGRYHYPPFSILQDTLLNHRPLDINDLIDNPDFQAYLIHLLEVNVEIREKYGRVIDPIGGDNIIQGIKVIIHDLLRTRGKLDAAFLNILVTDEEIIGDIARPITPQLVDVRLQIVDNKINERFSELLDFSYQLQNAFIKRALKYIGANLGELDTKESEFVERLVSLVMNDRTMKRMIL